MLSYHDYPVLRIPGQQHPPGISPFGRMNHEYGFSGTGVPKKKAWILLAF